MLYWTDINRYQAAKAEVFCSVQTESAYRVRDLCTGILHKLLTVKGNIRRSLCTVLGLTFLWCHVLNSSALDRVSIRGGDPHSTYNYSKVWTHSREIL